MIKIKNGNLKRGDFEVNDINLEIHRNKITALVGRNGTGKTSLIYGLIGSIPFTKTNPELKIGYVGNDAPFYTGYNLNEVVNLLRVIEPEFDVIGYKKYLDKFNLHLSSRFGELSKGEVKSFMLAIALTRNPDVLILDEMDVHLDQFKKEDLKGILLDYMKEGDKSIIMSTHQIEAYEDIMDDIIFIKENHLCYFGSVYDLKTNLEIVQCDEDALEHFELIHVVKNKYHTEALIQRKNDGLTPLKDILLLLERSAYEKIYF